MLHKLRNLLRHAPQHAHDEACDGFYKLMYAETEKYGREAHEGMLAKWKK